MRNVIDELPREQHAQVLNVMRAAWKLSDAEEGVKRLEGLARFLVRATPEKQAGQPLTLIVNWPALMKKGAAAQ